MDKVKQIAKQIGIFLVMLAVAKITIGLVAKGADKAKPGLGAAIASWF